jgi:hypothetical protein
MFFMTFYKNGIALCYRDSSLRFATLRMTTGGNHSFQNYAMAKIKYAAAKNKNASAFGPKRLGVSVKTLRCFVSGTYKREW